MINPDLYSWAQLTANVGLAMDGSHGAYFPATGKHWIFGGWLGGSNTINNQFSSSDGITWNAESAAPWTGRHTCAHTNKPNADGWIYLVNGDPYNIGNDGFLAKGSYRFNGTIWETITTDNGLGGYSLGELAELSDGFYYIAGQLTTDKTTARREVWKSTDNCATFTKVGDLPFDSGQVTGNVFILNVNDRIFKIGGGLYSDTLNLRTFPRKIYSTADGITWRYEGEMPYSMYGRTYSQIVNFAGGAWMIGGIQGSYLRNGGNLNLAEVWVTTDGINWVKQTTIPWATRHAATAWEGSDGIYICCGTSGVGMTLLSDAWKMTLIP